jgi:transketolase
MNQNLNPQFFDAPEMSANRSGFGRGLLEAGQKNSAVVALCADLTESTMMHLFAQEFPERFVQVGVAEQNLVTVASGMAAMGKTPFCSSYAMFSPGRNWEQIRTTIAYNDRKVIVVGSHTGVSVGPDGGTHQALEDIALMRILPNMTVVVPCDALEAERATSALADNQLCTTPAYLRLAREKSPAMTTEQTLFEIGKSYQLYQSDSAQSQSESPHVVIIGCGPLLAEALHAARMLDEGGHSIEVWNMHTIKPLDTEMLDVVAGRAQLIVTVEEHQVAGGLGSAVAEYLSGVRPVRILRIGVQDRFGQSGTMDELYREYGLDRDSIVRRVLQKLGQL